MPQELKRCTRCVLPETHETIVFDDEGVCNVCRGHEVKQQSINWDQKKKDLDELVKKYRDQFEYDCIVPFSGGKDSTWTLYYLLKEYGLKPLVVCFDHGFYRPNLLKNRVRISRKLGVDFHVFTPNWKVVRRLMLQSFLEKGDFCWHCHTGIFAYPMWVAIRHKVPLVFWGEPSAEYTAYYSYDQPDEVDDIRVNRYINLEITSDDMFVRLEGAVDERDLAPFKYPSLKMLRKINYRSVCLGSYVPWDVKKQSRIIEDELGWTGDYVEGVPPGYEYEKIECYLQGVRDYIKYIKRGYSRASHLASIDLRNQRLDRDEAMKMVKEHEGKRPPSLDLFLGHIGLSEEEFLEVAMSHCVSPFEFDPKDAVQGKKAHDYESWSRQGPMPKKDSRYQFERWRRQGKI